MDSAAGHATAITRQIYINKRDKYQVYTEDNGMGRWAKIFLDLLTPYVVGIKFNKWAFLCVTMVECCPTCDCATMQIATSGAVGWLHLD